MPSIPHINSINSINSYCSGSILQRPQNTQESNQYGRGTMSEEHIKDVRILEEKVWHWEGQEEGLIAEEL